MTAWKLFFYYMDLNKIDFVAVNIKHRRYNAINPHLIQIHEAGYRIQTREAFLPLYKMC